MDLTNQQELYGSVVQKAWEDADFKARLVADPVATLEAFTGKPLNIPAGKTLVVRDQTDDSAVYINIPPSKSIEDVELTDDQLEAVAGGQSLTIIDIEDILLPSPTFPETPIFGEFGSK